MASDSPPLTALPPEGPAAFALAAPIAAARQALPAPGPTDLWAAAPPQLDARLGLVPAVRRALVELAERASAIAAAAPSEPHRAIHAQRRTLRRGRALLRLIGPWVAPAQAKDWLARLGAASRQLGVFRDAEVLPAALGLIEVGDSGAVGELRLRLSESRELARRDPEALLQVRKTAEVLHAVALEAQGAELDASLPKLAHSLQQSMRRGRELARQAIKRPRPETVHELRKRAKDLRHQLEWLGMRRGDAELDTLVTWLGALGEVADLLALQAWLKERGDLPADRREIHAALRRSKAKKARRCLRDAKLALPGKAKRRARQVVAAAFSEAAGA